jgi:hypothetical protein
MTESDDQACKNDANQADEDAGAAPKPKTLTVNVVTITDVTRRRVGFAIVGGINLPDKKDET